MYALFSYAFLVVNRKHLCRSNGAMRFSVRGFGRALFYFLEDDMKRKRTAIFLAFIALLPLLCFCSCQSTDKNDAQFELIDFDKATYVYNKEKDQMEFVFLATIDNQTIYNIDRFSVTFHLYEGDVIAKTQTYWFDMEIKSGDSESSHLHIFHEKKFTGIGYVSFSASFASVWETYQTWFIVSGAVALVAAIIYFVIIHNCMLDIEDVWEFLTEHSGFFWMLIPFFGGFAALWSYIFSYWVQTLIVLGAILSFVLLCLIAHLIEDNI